MTGLAEELQAIPAMNIDALRLYWRERWEGPPPPLRSGDLMRRCIAERLQLEALGGDSELDKRLLRLAQAYKRGERPKAPKATFRTGAVLMREHGGQTHRVVVEAAGFQWEGTTYKSLSEIARTITGVRWNGPRFFGLREDASARGAV